MKIVLQQLPSTVKAPCRMPYLAPDAAESLLALEKDTDGLVYKDMWRDPVASLLSRQLKKTSQLPGYSPHNWGMAVDLDLKKILNEKKISYEDLLYLMKRRHWYCQRRDGDGTKPDSDHFNFLGEYSERYLSKCTMDPTTWLLATETKIMEKYGREFQLSPHDIQKLLSRIKLYSGPLTNTIDLYTRTAIIAFQKMMDLIPNGSTDIGLCRALAFMTADIQMI